MSHKPNRYDIKTDLRRSVMASYSSKKLADENVITFVENARKNLKLLEKEIGTRKYNQVMERITKYGNEELPIIKRRENLLTASFLI